MALQLQLKIYLSDVIGGFGPPFFMTTIQQRDFTVEVRLPHGKEILSIAAYSEQSALAKELKRFRKATRASIIGKDGKQSSQT